MSIDPNDPIIEAPVETPEETPARRRRWPKLVGVGVALFGVGLGGFFALSKAGASETNTITGVFKLIDIPEYSKYSSGKTSIFAFGGTCEGTGGYSDISEATQVTITDGAGKLLAVTSLSEGKPSGSKLEGFVEGCTFSWSAPDIPKADFYNIEVGRRGKLTYSYQQMEDVFWISATSLGD